MFTNNPLFIEKLIRAKQDDILGELPDRHAYELQEVERFPVRLRTKSKIWIPIEALLMLAWRLNVLH